MRAFEQAESRDPAIIISCSADAALHTAELAECGSDAVRKAMHARHGWA